MYVQSTATNSWCQPENTKAKVFSTFLSSQVSNCSFQWPTSKKHSIYWFWIWIWVSIKPNESCLHRDVKTKLASIVANYNLFTIWIWESLNWKSKNKRKNVFFFAKLQCQCYYNRINLPIPKLSYVAASFYWTLNSLSYGFYSQKQHSPFQNSNLNLT